MAMVEEITPEMMKVWCEAYNAGVMRSHFVCMNEGHLNRLIALGEIEIVRGVPVKLSSMKPVWLPPMK